MKRLILFSLTILLLSSCARRKYMVYLNDMDQTTETTKFRNVPPEYKIQQNDVLYITVVTLDPEINQVLNPNLNTTGYSQFNVEANQYILGYAVNDSGYIEMPVLGEIEVANHSIAEITDKIRQKALLYLKEPAVTVKLLSFRYSVIGEVNYPGMFNNYNKQLNVLEAISKAGDITPYGNRTKAVVIRQGEEGSEIFSLDLTSTKVLNSQGYYILPNDVIYIPPVKSKTFRTNIPVISVGLGAISTMVLILNYMNKK